MSRHRVWSTAALASTLSPEVVEEHRNIWSVDLGERCGVLTSCCPPSPGCSVGRAPPVGTGGFLDSIVPPAAPSGEAHRTGFADLVPAPSPNPAGTAPAAVI